jgi:hypothetical protein
MTVKTTGAEFKRFYADDTIWPDDVWHEDEVVIAAGEEWSLTGEPYENIPDAAIVRIDGGGIFGLPDDKEVSFEGYFKAWRKRQATVSFLVECDKAKLDELKAMIKTAGARAL